MSPQIYVAVLERESFTSRVVGPPKNWRAPFPQEFELRTFYFFFICFSILLLSFKFHDVSSFQYCSQDSIQSYSSQASTVSSDENERQETCRVDVAKRQKCNDNASSSLVIIDNSQDVSHVMKHGKKMIGELHDKRNEMILDAILREAAHDG